VHQFGQRGLRYRKVLTPAAHDERRNNGQRERDAEPQDGALAGVAFHIDLAADLLHIGAHHIHAYPASGDAGHGFGRGKAGQKDQLQDLALVHLFGALRRETSWRSTALRRIRSRLIPAPSSWTSTMTWLPS
jgi:hypothetical protein